MQVYVIATSERIALPEHLDLAVFTDAYFSSAERKKKAKVRAGAATGSSGCLQAHIAHGCYMTSHAEPRTVAKAAAIVRSAQDGRWGCMEQADIHDGE